MSKLALAFSKVADGDEGDFADALETIASQIREAVEYGDELRGKVSAGDVTAEWVIES